MIKTASQSEGHLFYLNLIVSYYPISCSIHLQSIVSPDIFFLPCFEFESVCAIQGQCALLSTSSVNVYGAYDMQ